MIWEFSQNPERFYLFTLDNDEELDIEEEPQGWTGISIEDSGIAADIDSSSVLISDLNQMQPLEEMQIPRRGTNSNLRALGARPQQKGTPPPPNRDVGTVEGLNPQGEDLYNLPELSLLPPLDPSSQELPSLSVPGMPTLSGNAIETPPLPGSRLGIYSGSVNNFQTPDVTQLPVSPLQAAMDRLYSPKASTSGDRNSDDTQETQSSESTPQQQSNQGETNQGSSPENRPNSPQNPANSGSPTSPSPYGNTPQPAQTPNGTPQNVSSPSGNTAQSPQSPYGTSPTSPSPYGNTPQPTQTLNGTPPNPYLVEEFSPNRGYIDPNVPITPRLPGEISPSYGVDYTENNYQPLPSIPPVLNSNPTNAYDYLLRSGGELVPLAPGAPTAVPLPASNLETPSYQAPNSAVYQTPSNQPMGNSPSVSPGVQPLNQPGDRPSPSSVNSPTNVPTYQPLNPPSVPSPPMDSSGLNLNTDTPGVQTLPPIQLFSVPNSIPGRYIGGGNINTFSNP